MRAFLVERVVEPGLHFSLFWRTAAIRADTPACDSLRAPKSFWPAWRVLACLLTISPASAATNAVDEIIVSVVGGNDASGRDAGFRALAEAYQRLHPECRVVLEAKGNGHGVGYTAWLNTELTSGAPRPDVVSGNYSPDYSRYVNFDYYAGQKNPYTGHAWSDDLDFNFFKSTNSRGERIIVSTQMVKIVWYYNRDIFERLGLRPPESWSEFLKSCAILRTHGLVPISMRFNYRYYQWLMEVLYDQYMRSNIELVRARPGDWCFDPLRDGNWKFNPADPFNDATPTINFARLLAAVRRGDIRYDTPAFKEVLENLKSLAPHTPSDFLVDTPSADSEAYTLFLNGVSAIHLDTSALLNQLDADIAGAGKFRWSSFDTPSLAGPLVQGPARAVESAAGEYIAVIRKDQAHTDRVIDFLHFWLSPSGYQLYVDAQVASGRFKPHGLIMVRGVKLPPSFQDAFSRAVRRGNAEMPVNYISAFLPSGSRLVVDFRRTLTEFVQGKLSTDECAREIQRIMNAAVDEVVANNHLDASFLEHPERDPNG